MDVQILGPAMSTPVSVSVKIEKKKKMAHLDLHCLQMYMSWPTGIKGLFSFNTPLQFHNERHYFDNKIKTSQNDTNRFYVM